MVGQIQVRNGQPVPGPGVKRSTELFLAQDRGPAEKRQWVITDQHVVVNRHETRSVNRCVLRAVVESAPVRQRAARNDILAHSGRDSPCTRSNSIIR